MKIGVIGSRLPGLVELRAVESTGPFSHASDFLFFDDKNSLMYALNSLTVLPYWQGLRCDPQSQTLVGWKAEGVEVFTDLPVLADFLWDKINALISAGTEPQDGQRTAMDKAIYQVRDKCFVFRVNPSP